MIVLESPIPFGDFAISSNGQIAIRSLHEGQLYHFIEDSSILKPLLPKGYFAKDPSWLGDNQTLLCGAAYQDLNYSVITIDINTLKIDTIETYGSSDKSIITNSLSKDDRIIYSKRSQKAYFSAPIYDLDNANLIIDFESTSRLTGISLRAIDEDKMIYCSPTRISTSINGTEFVIRRVCRDDLIWEMNISPDGKFAVYELHALVDTSTQPNTRESQIKVIDIENCTEYKVLP